MKNLSSIIGWFLLLIALGLYLYGVFFAIKISLQANIGKEIPELHEILDTLTATIGAILLTNFGAVLGISVTQPKSGLAGKMLINKVELPDPMTRREIIQFFAVLVYLITLVACFITWAINSFHADDQAKPVATLVSQNGKMLIGVISAYVAFVLGENRA